MSKQTCGPEDYPSASMVPLLSISSTPAPSHNDNNTEEWGTGIPSSALFSLATGLQPLTVVNLHQEEIRSENGIPWAWTSHQFNSQLVYVILCIFLYVCRRIMQIGDCGSLSRSTISHSAHYTPFSPNIHWICR